MSIKFEIIKGYNEVNVKTIPLGDGSKKDVFNQDMFIHKGGPFPERIVVGVESIPMAYPIGFYELDPKSFTTNKYGALELSKYDTKFIKIS